MPPRKPKQIRLRKVYVFCTYADCDLPLQDVYDQLVIKLRTLGNYIKRYIIAHEIAPTTGLPHRHCWLHLASAPDFVDADVFHLDGHNKTHKGNYQAIKYEENCKDYVIKDGDIITNMTKDEMDKIKNSQPQQKISKAEIGKLIIEGKELKELALLYPQIIYDYNKLKSNIKSFRRDTADVRNLETLENEWYFGGTGCGKSKQIHDKYPTKCKKTKDIYFNNYCGEDILYFEDFDGSWGDVVWNMKEIADHYPFEAQCKLAEPMLIRPKKIIVTSNYTIREVYEQYFKMREILCDNILIGAIERRFKVIKIDSPINPDPLNVFPDNYFLLPDCDDEITYDKYLDPFDGLFDT